MLQISYQNGIITKYVHKLNIFIILGAELKGSTETIS